MFWFEVCKHACSVLELMLQCRCNIVAVLLQYCWTVVAVCCNLLTTMLKRVTSKSSEGMPTNLIWCEVFNKLVYSTANCVWTRDLRSFEIRIRISRPIRFDSKVIGRFKNYRICRACSFVVVSLVKQLKPLTVRNGTVYRLANSMSDHTPVVFNVFEDFNDEYVVPHTFFASFVTTDFNN